MLAALRKNNRLSFSELADLVSSSAASCMRRVNKLRADGVITADISLVDPKALGKSLTVVVAVELDRERLDLVDDFKRSMRAAKEVTLCYMITGDADFVLIVAVEDVEAFDVFVKTKVYTNPNVREFSMIALDRVKFEPRLRSRALDGSLAGASHREIAEALIGEGRVRPTGRVLAMNARSHPPRRHSR
ncbi:Lrp/AsnC ligand binding domain-containing protein [Mesorhizobium sp. BHbdii]